MKRGPASVLAGLAAAAVIAAATVAFFHFFEPETTTVDSGYGPVASANPYLAAARLWSRLGLDVQARDVAPVALPPAGTTLVVPGARTSLEQRVPELVRWVRAGGHLVVVANASSAGAGAEDALLASYGVGTISPPKIPAPQKGKLSWPGRPPLSADLAGDVVLVAAGRPPILQAETGGSPVVLRFADGEGSLTILASARFLANDAIGQADHALLAWLLVAGTGGASGPVTLVVSDRAPGLLALLARARPALLPALCCLIAVLVWRGAARLGPIRPPGDPPRRSQSEHVEATGRFLWRTRHGDALAAAVRESLEQRLRRHPASAQAGQLPPLPVPLSEKGFVEAVAAMERMRRTL